MIHELSSVNRKSKMTTSDLRKYVKVTDNQSCPNPWLAALACQTVKL